MLQKLILIGFYWVLFFIGICSVAAGLLRVGLWDAFPVAIVVTLGLSMTKIGVSNAVRFSNELGG